MIVKQQLVLLDVLAIGIEAYSIDTQMGSARRNETNISLQNIVDINKARVS